MWETGYCELEQNIRPRENLSLLRREAKMPEVRQALKERAGDGALLAVFLQSDDPKVRKNAALLIGDLGLVQAAGALFDAYRKEQTLFVRSAYITALGQTDASPYIKELKVRSEDLASCEPAEDEKKHAMDELRELEAVIAGVEGIRPHTFAGFADSHEFVLATGRELRQATLADVERLPETIRRTASMHPLGVSVRTKDLRAVAQLRTYRELLFPIHTERKYAGVTEPVDMAEAVWRSDMPQLLAEMYREETPFYFRLEIRGQMDPHTKSRFARQFAEELARISGRRFVNSTSGYELEIRLVWKKDGGYAAFFRLPGLMSDRFSYRKHTTASSMHPATAAAVIELARSYLKEGAQVLDPFCGVGTLLIERGRSIPAGERYGIDIFAEAIWMARENAGAAGEKIRFINRDYYTFQYDSVFDEIVTDMPVRGKSTREELDGVYGRFFEKSRELLTPGAVVVMCSGEEGFVKKHLRLCADYRLEAEHCLRERDRFCLFVIRYKG